jgi:hypothetical protein
MTEPIQKCERCYQLEELAEGFRLALIESSKLLEFLIDPSTTDADRAEIRKRVFEGTSGPSSEPEWPPTPSGAPKAQEKPVGCRVIEHGPAGDPSCPDCRAYNSWD